MPATTPPAGATGGSDDVTLFHHTSSAAAAAIMQRRYMTSAVPTDMPFAFFSDRRTGNASGRLHYGEACVELRLPMRLLVAEETFRDGETYYRVRLDDLRPEHFVAAHYPDQPGDRSGRQPRDRTFGRQASRAEPPYVGQHAREAELRVALARAGIELGGYDERIVSWLSGFTESRIVTSWLIRARHAAGHESEGGAPVTRRQAEPWSRTDEERSYRTGRPYLARVRGVEDQIVYRDPECKGLAWRTAQTVAGKLSHLSEDVTDIRPGYVFDLGAWQNVPALVRELRVDGWGTLANQVEAQIEARAAHEPQTQSLRRCDRPRPPGPKPPSTPGPGITP